MVVVTVTYTSTASPNASFDDIEIESTTVGEIKTYIEEHYDIPTGQQILFYDNMLMLNNEKRLSDLGPVTPKEMTLYRKLSPQPITVTIASSFLRNFPLLVASIETVSGLKKAIDFTIGLSPHRQKLIVTRNELHDDDTLDEYIISAEPKFYLEELAQDEPSLISVNVASYTYDAEANVVPLQRTFRVSRSDTIYMLRRLVREAGLANGYEFILGVRGGRTVYGPETLEELEIGSGGWFDVMLSP